MNETTENTLPATGGREHYPLWLLAFFLIVMVLLHLPSFSARHHEGDERVYLMLARDMSWDLSYYTTRDHPYISKYPYSIYRAELFHQPPLYPLILKAGIKARAVILTGLSFQVFSMGLLLVFARQASKRHHLSIRLQAALYAAMVCVPW